ncbi:serine/threonine-protein kinase [Nocardia vermiculata]|uniref:non-specific serine/threonine protein kinase n=1 Tax=Nocardia vermiculata TaxID=257274 RepID=A0A846XYX7_9NOCA|nr:serine/threonine-protein kinase [Nocardia vermiculata]NKY50581.1 protein kinase [Nocardia vermiculata]
MSPRQFGRYRLDRLLGRGSAGEVWLAYDPGSARTVALKILSGSAAEDPDYRRRFEREARIGSHIANPHIAPIHGFGEVGGRLYLDMAYIPGVDLAQLIRGATMTAAEAVELISQIAEALDAAHAAGLIHRDVKPANIIVHPSGFAYLIDFGIARAAGQSTITATGFTVGTLAYMAPERFTGGGDARSDIYSLACVLYEALTARRPFGDTDAVQQLHSHLHQPPPRPTATDPRVPIGLDAVVARGMAKNPQDRYRTAGELAAAARAAAGAAPTQRVAPVLQSEAVTTQLSRGEPGPPGPAGAFRAPAAAPPPGTAVPPRTLALPPNGATGAAPLQSAGGHRPTPTVVASTPFPIETAAPHAPVAPPRRRSATAVAAALIGVGLVALAVIAGCTALLTSGNDAPTDPATTTGAPATSAPQTTAPETPEPEYTTAVIPPPMTIPLPTGIFVPPPFRIPGAAYPQDNSAPGAHRQHGPKQDEKKARDGSPEAHAAN